MGRTIYDKSTRVLVKDMVLSLSLRPGQVFTTGRAIQWYAEHYPKLKANSIRGHLVQASTNDRSRLHHPSTDERDDILFKVAPGQFRLYEAMHDPAPIHELVDGDVAKEEALSEETGEYGDEEEVASDGAAAPGSSEFLLERDLQNFLARNLDVIEPGLRLYADEATNGIEVDAGGRRMDILAVDRDDNLVVLELKVSKGYDRVVGQLLRYMNWVRRKMAEPGQNARGMIVCRRLGDDLKLACLGLPGIELYEYQLSVTVTKGQPLLE